MHSPLAIYLLGLPKMTVSFPLLNSPYFSILISTRNKNIKIDNSADITVPHNFDFVQNVLQGKNYEKTYTSNFTGDQLVQLLGGQKDVYSLQLQAYNDSGTYLNIQDWGKFINQFVQLFSLVFRINTHTNSVIKGNLADIPDSVEHIRLNFLTLSNATDFYLNFSGFKSTSKLKYFFQENNSFLINGDLSNLPPLVNFFKVTTLVSGSSITYTAGKVWASAFDTLSIPVSFGNFLEADALYTDMGNSITSAVGGKLISIGGWFSGTAKVIYLKSLGFTFGGLDTSTGTASSTTQKFIGDIAQIPSDVTFFKIVQCAAGSEITYTGGKVWATTFDTLNLPLFLKNSEIDSLINDMATSITSFVGSKVVSVMGFRTINSASSTTYLQGLGATVNIPLVYNKLNLPLSANYNDTSGNSNNATATGTPIFDSGALKTSTNNFATVADSDSLDIRTSSFEFGCDFKINSYTSGVVGIVGKSIGASVTGRYGIYLNGTSLFAYSQMATTPNNSTDLSSVNDGQWHSVRLLCNRTEGRQYLFIDSVLINTTTFTPNSTNYNTSGKFFIGAYGNTTGSDKQAGSEFNGWIKNVFFSKT